MSQDGSQKPLDLPKIKIERRVSVQEKSVRETPSASVASIKPVKRRIKQFRGVPRALACI